MKSEGGRDKYIEPDIEGAKWEAWLGHQRLSWLSIFYSLPRFTFRLKQDLIVSWLFSSKGGFSSGPGGEGQEGKEDFHFLKNTSKLSVKVVAAEFCRSPDLPAPCLYKPLCMSFPQESSNGELWPQEPVVGENDGVNSSHCHRLPIYRVHSYTLSHSPQQQSAVDQVRTLYLQHSLITFATSHLSITSPKASLSPLIPSQILTLTFKNCHLHFPLPSAYTCSSFLLPPLWKPGGNASRPKGAVVSEYSLC